MRNWTGIGVAVAILALAANPAAAEWPNDKPIKFVIPYSPGGGFDTIVRAFAPALEKELGATVVPENIPGAGGAKGAASVFRSDPDGYTIGIFNIPGYTVTKVMGEDLGFDLDAVTWVANLATSRYAIAVKGDSSIKSLEDLCAIGRPVKLSDTGANSTSSVAARISFNMINCPLVNVTGYKGSNDAMIAVMRGEVDGTLKPISSLKKYTDSGDLRLILTYTDGPAVEGVPSSGALGHKEFAKLDLRRLIGAPPGLPDDIRKRLSDALIKAAASAEVQDWAKGAGEDIDAVGSDEATAMMAGLSGFYGQFADFLKQQQ